jgi:hypothetical protein
LFAPGVRSAGERLDSGRYLFSGLPAEDSGREGSAASASVCAAVRNCGSPPPLGTSAQLRSLPIRSTRNGAKISSCSGSVIVSSSVCRFLRASLNAHLGRWFEIDNIKDLIVIGP